MTGPLIDLAGRVRDRDREARQRRVTLTLRVVIVLTVIAVLGWIVTASPLLSVKKVVVTGNKVVSTETITGVAAVPLGAPLARVDAAGISSRLAQVPGLGGAEVSLGWPDTVTIAVTERAIAFTLASNGGYAWVDATGQVFGQSKERPAGVLVAQVKDPSDQRLMADVATVSSAVPARLLARLKGITADTRDSITLTTNEGGQVVWGSAEKSTLKGQLADAFTQAQPKCRLVDVSSPTLPTVKC